ncbi:hypothetical protein ABFA07_004241 [Porites harrisoni]
MGERLKTALRGYLKYRLIMRIIWAFVGVVVGIAGCIAFAKVYHNYNAAIWAGVSALFAVVFLHLHFAVRRDIERIIPRSKFTVIMYIGLTGLIAGVVGFFTNLALGIHRHETGIHTDQNYIVCVWNFMTFKWGLFSFLAARKFRMLYFEMDPQSRGLVQEA